MLAEFGTDLAMPNHPVSERSLPSFKRGVKMVMLLIDGHQADLISSKQLGLWPSLA